MRCSIFNNAPFVGKFRLLFYRCPIFYFSSFFFVQDQSLGTYELPMNFTKDVEVALSLTPMTMFERYVME